MRCRLHNWTLVVAVALLGAACARPPTPSATMQLTRQGATLRVYVSHPVASPSGSLPDAYHALALPAGDWDQAVGTLSREAPGFEPIVARADVAFEPDTGRRLATLNFEGIMPLPGYRLEVSLYRLVSDQDPVLVATQTQTDVTLAPGENSVNLSPSFTQVPEALPASTPILNGSVVSLPRDGVGARLMLPASVAVSGAGVGYVADSNGTIRRIASEPDGRLYATFLVGDGVASAGGTPAAGGTPGLNLRLPATVGAYTAPGLGSKGMALVGDGTLYFLQGNTIRRAAIAENGQATVFPQAILNGPNEASPGAAATLTALTALAAGPDGTLVIAEGTKLRLLIPNGAGAFEAASMVGSTTAGITDGDGAAAGFTAIRGLAIASDGTVYVADGTRNRVRKVVSNGAGGYTVSTLPPHATTGFNNVSAVALDAQGGLFVGDSQRVFRYDRTAGDAATPEVIAGGSSQGFVDGDGPTARFAGVLGLAVAPDGSLWAADNTNQRVRRLAQVGGAWQVTTRVGDGIDCSKNQGICNTNGPVDRPSLIQRPTGVAVAVDGTVYLADPIANRIFALDPAGDGYKVVAGTGVGTFAEGTGATAAFNGPAGLAVEADGSLVVTDVGNGRVRRIRFDATGQATTSTITTSSQIQYPSAIAILPGGDLVVSEAGSPVSSAIGPHRLHRVHEAGGSVTVSLIAGGTSRGSTEGTGAAARFNLPTGLWVESATSLLVADGDNHRIRRVTLDEAGVGTTTTVAGNGAAGYGGTTVATAQFDRPSGVVMDAAGRILVTDYWHHWVRVLGTDGSFTTYTGKGEEGFVDGPSRQARFSRPAGLALGADGAVYVVDASGFGVRKVLP